MIKIVDVKKYFPIEKGFLKKESGFIKAVDGVSLEIKKGKTLGLVGESGSGKTTLGKIIADLIKPDCGKIFIDNTDMSELTKSEKRLLRKKVQFIFQDPYGSLDPRMTLKEIITEPIKIMENPSKINLENRFAKILGFIKLPKLASNKYPHQFSGGERQRINIGRALSLEPEFIVCDEPVSSLDVSIQAQILNLLKELQETLNLTYLFISHDLSVVEFVSDEISVMFNGKIVEKASKLELFKNPMHPYTKILLKSIPIPDPKKSREPLIIGDFNGAYPLSGLREVAPDHFAAL